MRKILVCFSPQIHTQNPKKWFKTQPLGVNTIRKWSSEAALEIGCVKKITNQGQRATAASRSAEHATPAQSCDITGHRDPRSLGSYTTLDPKLRGELGDAICGMGSKPQIGVFQAVASPQPEKVLAVASPQPEKASLSAIKRTRFEPFQSSPLAKKSKKTTTNSGITIIGGKFTNCLIHNSVSVQEEEVLEVHSQP